MMNKKTIVKSIFLIMVIILGFSGITYGLLIDQTESKTNAFFPGVLTAPIVENGNLAPDNTNILTPDNLEVTKQVQIQNIANPHEVDAYIRVMLVPVFRSGEGTLAGDMSLDPNGNDIIVTAPSGQTATLKLISGWQENWVYSDGYYYYKNIVHPGANTAILLNSINVSENALWDSFYVEVLADSIQAEGGAIDEVWSHTIASQLETP
jgi:hypothetical protein